MQKSKLFCWKRFEYLLIAFEGVNVDISRYIVVGTVNALPVHHMGESVERQETWLSKT